MIENGITTDWRAVVLRGIESEELDYKAAQNWQKLTKAGKARFARHCMAMANTKGGYIVVGVGEDKSGKPCLYTGVSPMQSRSFDPTDVGNVINRYSDPPVDFDIERPTVDGKRYVIFVIRRFSQLPHVCCHSCESELQQGVFYIRTADASSRPAFKASEVHGIVQRALRNQRELLGRMLRGILYEGKKSFNPNSRREFIEQITNSRRIFDRIRAEFDHSDDPLFEISVFPSEFVQEKFMLSQIKSAVENSGTNAIESPFIIVGSEEDCYFTNVAYRSLSKDSRQFWQAFKSGLFHCSSFIPAGERTVAYLDLVRIIAYALAFFGRYYYELGYADELFNINFRISNVNGVALSGAEISGTSKHSKDASICRIPEIEFSFQRTAADIMSGTVQHSIRAVTEICERFNLPEGKHQKLEKIIVSLLEKRRG